jgi:hypothetical protein
MSIVLPDIASWPNYVPQSEEIEGPLFWYGIPHPQHDPLTAGSTVIPNESFTKPSTLVPSERLTKSSTWVPNECLTESSILVPSERLTESSTLVLTDGFTECSTSGGASQVTHPMLMISWQPSSDAPQSLMVAAGLGVEIIKEAASVGLLVGCVIGFCLFALAAGIAISFFFKGRALQRSSSEHEEIEATSAV